MVRPRPSKFHDIPANHALIAPQPVLTRIFPVLDIGGARVLVRCGTQPHAQALPSSPRESWVLQLQGVQFLVNLGFSYLP